MCRLLAYDGPPIEAGALLLRPPHSLYHQSYAPREMTSGTVNADGYGLAWYDPDRRAEPFLYRTILPIWNDANLSTIGDYVRAPHLLANVRSATPGQALDFSNTQPFVSGRLAVLHNGFVDNFRTTLYRLIRDGISDDAYAALAGTTDSEHLFAWILHHVEVEGDLATGTRAALAALVEVAPDARMTLNFIISDGRALVATRYAHNAACPTLYWARGLADFPDAIMIASEPLTEDDAWRPLDEHALVRIVGDGTLERESLLDA